MMDCKRRMIVLATLSMLAVVLSVAVIETPEEADAANPLPHHGGTLSSGTYDVTSNWTLTSSLVIPAGNTVTINVSEGIVLGDAIDFPMITVNGTLTLDGGGEVSSNLLDDMSSSPVIIVNSTGTLNLKSIWIAGPSNYAVQINSDSATVTMTSDTWVNVSEHYQSYCGVAFYFNFEPSYDKWSFLDQYRNKIYPQLGYRFNYTFLKLKYAEEESSYDIAKERIVPQTAVSEPVTIPTKEGCDFLGYYYGEIQIIKADGTFVRNTSYCSSDGKWIFPKSNQTLTLELEAHWFAHAVEKGTDHFYENLGAAIADTGVSSNDYTIHFSTTETASFTVPSGATISFADNKAITGSTSSIKMTIGSGSTVTFNGTGTLAITTENSGTVRNYGTITNLSGNTITNKSGGTIENYYDAAIDRSGTHDILINHGTITNSGTITGSVTSGASGTVIDGTLNNYSIVDGKMKNDKAPTSSKPGLVAQTGSKYITPSEETSSYIGFYGYNVVVYTESSGTHTYYTSADDALKNVGAYTTVEVLHDAIGDNALKTAVTLASGKSLIVNPGAKLGITGVALTNSGTITNNGNITITGAGSIVGSGTFTSGASSSITQPTLVSPPPFDYTSAEYATTSPSSYTYYKTVDKAIDAANMTTGRSVQVLVDQTLSTNKAVNLGNTLIVAAGKTLAVSNCTLTNSGTITNNGNMVLTGAGSVTAGGTFTAGEDSTFTKPSLDPVPFDYNASVFATSSPTSYTFYMNAAKAIDAANTAGNSTVQVCGNSTLGATKTLDAGNTLVVTAGASLAVANSCTLTFNGNVTNNGSISIGTGAAVTKGTGTFTSGPNSCFAQQTLEPVPFDYTSAEFATGPSAPYTYYKTVDKAIDAANTTTGRTVQVMVDQTLSTNKAVNLGNTLIVAEDTTLTVSSCTLINSGTITNSGNMVLTGTGSVTSGGTFNAGETSTFTQPGTSPTPFSYNTAEYQTGSSGPCTFYMNAAQAIDAANGTAGNRTVEVRADTGLDADKTLNSGKTLIVADGASLAVGDDRTLTVAGAVTNNGNISLGTEAAAVTQGTGTFTSGNGSSFTQKALTPAPFDYTSAEYASTSPDSYTFYKTVGEAIDKANAGSSRTVQVMVDQTLSTNKAVNLGNTLIVAEDTTLTVSSCTLTNGGTITNSGNMVLTGTGSVTSGGTFNAGDDSSFTQPGLTPTPFSYNTAEYQTGSSGPCTFYMSATNAIEKANATEGNRTVEVRANSSLDESIGLNANKTLIVNAGASLTVEEDCELTVNGAVTNNGNISLETDAKVIMGLSGTFVSGEDSTFTQKSLKPAPFDYTSAVYDTGSTGPYTYYMTVEEAIDVANATTGKTVHVLKDQTLSTSKTVNAGNELIVDGDAELSLGGKTLTINGSMTNNGTLYNNGSLVNNGTITAGDGSEYVKVGGQDDENAVLFGYYVSVNDGTNYMYYITLDEAIAESTSVMKYIDVLHDCYLSADASIPAGVTLTVRDDMTVTMADNVTLTNSGTITLVDDGVIVAGANSVYIKKSGADDANAEKFGYKASVHNGPSTDHAYYMEVVTAIGESSSETNKFVDVITTCDLEDTITLPAGITLGVNAEKTFTIPTSKTLTNNGTIENSGIIALDGTGKVVAGASSKYIMVNGSDDANAIAFGYKASVYGDGDANHTYCVTPDEVIALSSEEDKYIDIIDDCSLVANATISEGVTISVNAEKTFTIPAEKTLTNNGTFDNFGIVTNNGTFDNAGTLNNEAVADGYGLITNNGTLDNSGTLNNEKDGDKAARVVNASTGTLDNSGTLTNDSTIDSAGGINVIGGGTITATQPGSGDPYHGTINVTSTAAGAITILSGTIEFQHITLPDAGDNASIVLDVPDAGDREAQTFQNNIVDMGGSLGVLVKSGGTVPEGESLMLTVTDNVFNGGKAGGHNISIGSDAGDEMDSAMAVDLRGNTLSKPLDLLVKNMSIATEPIAEPDAPYLIVSDGYGMDIDCEGVVKFVDSVEVSDVEVADGTALIVAKEQELEVTGSLTNGGLVLNYGEITGWEKSGRTLTLLAEPPEGGTVVEVDIDLENYVVKATTAPSEGFGFDRWQKGQNYDYEKTKEFKVDGVIAWDAIFSMSVTVTYDSMGGSDVPPETVHYKETFTEPEDPVKERYTFAGWYTSETFTELYDFHEPATKSITLYARWVPAAEVMHTVKFMVAGEEDPYATMEVRDGLYASKPAVDPTMENKKFLGWYLTDSYPVDPEQKFDFSTQIREDTTLYAGWTDKIVIAIPTNGGNPGFTIEGSGVFEANVDAVRNFTVTTEPGYMAIVTFGTETFYQDPNVITVYEISGYDVNVNVTVDCIKIDSGESVRESKEVIDNDDSTITEITTKAVSNDNGTTITEKAETKDAINQETTSTTETTAVFKEAGTGATATVTIETDAETAVVSDSMATALSELAAGTGGTTIVLRVEPQKITVPSYILSDPKIEDVTMVVNLNSSREASITVPTSAMVDMSNNISIIVTDPSKTAPARIVGDSTSGASFDLKVIGADFTFNKKCTIGYKTTIPGNAIASSLRLVCLDNGEIFNDVEYDGTSIYFETTHFSTYVVLYDVDMNEDYEDDDILHIIDMLRNRQQQAHHDSTMEIMAVIVAAAAVLLVTLMMFMYLRRD